MIFNIAQAKFIYSEGISWYIVKIIRSGKEKNTLRQIFVSGTFYFCKCFYVIDILTDYHLPEVCERFYLSLPDFVRIDLTRHETNLSELTAKVSNIGKVATSKSKF